MLETLATWTGFSRISGNEQQGIKTDSDDSLQASRTHRMAKSSGLAKEELQVMMQEREAPLLPPLLELDPEFIEV